MGTGCSLCCTKCVDTICCCSPCCKKCCKRPKVLKPLLDKATSPIARLLRTVGTMPIERSLRSIGISTMPEPPQPAGTWEINVIPTERIDISSLDRIAEAVNFSDIVNGEILLVIDTKKKLLQKEAPKKTKLNPKLPQNCAEWHDKCFVHGMLSDIVADVKGQTHGCINSSISDDIDRYFAILHDVNDAAAKILQDRLLNIALREKSSIDRFIQERDELISTLLRRGRLYINQYEEDYRRLIQKFITTLEIEMSKHLDYLQNQIEADKESIFQGVNMHIQLLTDEAERARGDFHRLLQQAAASKRQEIIDLIETSSRNKTNQPLGYEQFKKFNVEIYSTVGMKNDGQGCDNIPDRGKFIRDIDRVKPPPPRITRTVYIEQYVDQQQTNRNKDS